MLAGTIDFTSIPRVINPKVARWTETDSWVKVRGVKPDRYHDESIMQRPNWNIMLLSRGDCCNGKSEGEEWIDTVSDGD